MSNFEHGEAEVELTAYFSETIYETKFLKYLSFLISYVINYVSKIIYNFYYYFIYNFFYYFTSMRRI